MLMQDVFQGIAVFSNSINILFVGNQPVLAKCRFGAKMFHEKFNAEAYSEPSEIAFCENNERISAYTKKLYLDKWALNLSQ